MYYDSELANEHPVFHLGCLGLLLVFCAFVLGILSSSQNVVQDKLIEQCVNAHVISNCTDYAIWARHSSNDTLWSCVGTHVFGTSSWKDLLVFASSESIEKSLSVCLEAKSLTIQDYMEKNR
jgi:hypothetical protein